MYAKRVKRKCMVRGCKGIDTYSISRTRESGNSVIVCIDCLVGGIKAAKAVEKTPIAEFVPREAPVLFFSGEISAPATEDDSEEGFVCKHCGRECASHIGLISHLRACEKKVGEDDE